MALVSCKECRKKISDKAGSCPSCGNPTRPTQKPDGRFLGISTPVWVLIVFTGLAYTLFDNDVANTIDKPTAQTAEVAPKAKTEAQVVKSAAMTCKLAAKNAAQWGADMDLESRYQSAKMPDGSILIEGSDIKFKNEYGAEGYATYIGIYDLKNAACTIQSIEF